jgi:hypothetical protein
MTNRLVTPWWRDRSPVDAGHAVAGSTGPTRILDWTSPQIRALIADISSRCSETDLDFLRCAHSTIASRVGPVYSVMDRRPVSRTLSLERGSCSQRLALLEAVARGFGIATRVRGLLVDGRFWYPRFRWVSFAVPNQVVLPWPEFLVDSEWLEASEIFGTLEDLSIARDGGFENSEGETLFEAIACTAVDWDGQTRAARGNPSCDLSANVLADLGRFASRDLLYRQYGQTLSWPFRVGAELMIGHRPA